MVLYFVIEKSKKDYLTRISRNNNCKKKVAFDKQVVIYSVYINEKVYI